MPPVECANPILLSFVKEWLDTAQGHNSKGVTVYKKAYNSLKACPLPFQHPSEAQQLHGFGPKLCSKLTERLNTYCTENSLPLPELPYKTKKKKRSANDGDEEDGSESPPVKKVRKPKAYVPTLRSGPYALIIALSTLSEDAPQGITKQEVIDIAQPHCDSSFMAPSDTTKFYTAWNSMKTLVEKDLVYEKGRPLRRYALTEEGWEVAKRIKKTLDPTKDTVVPDQEVTVNSMNNENDKAGFMELGSSPARATTSHQTHANTQTDTAVDIVPIGDFVSDENSLPTFSPITLHPSSFTVELVLDIREIRAKEDRNYMETELTKKGVKPFMRALDVGDALWVAKCHDPKLLTQMGAEGDEVMLDWIVERKRLDDLVSSIKDGRFHEQKFRLRKSGAKNVIYIIEEISMNSDHFQKYEEAVESAIASSQVVDGYFVKKTQKMDDTVRYLARMTELLKAEYATKPLQLIPTKVLTSKNYIPLLTQLSKSQPSTSFNITYPAFASLASKSETLTLRDVFLKMLMCTRGITGEKALEIQQRWKTPHDFIEAFASFQTGEFGLKERGELVMKSMGNLVGRKKIGKTLSFKLADVWGDVYSKVI